MVLYKGIQDDINLLGNYGCAFMCACYVLSLDIEVLPKKIAQCRNNLSIDDDFTILNWERLFETLAPSGPVERKWKVVKTDKWTTDFDYCIGMYFNPKTNYTHFVVLDKEKQIVFDPLKFSVTVKDGFLKNYRFVYAS